MAYTTKTTLSFDSSEYFPHVNTVLVGNHVWIMFEEDEGEPTDKQLFKFQIDTLALAKVDCTFPVDMRGNLYEITSYRQNICAFFVEHGEIENTASLFKFDVDTLRWTFIMQFSYVNGVKYGPIVEDQFHYVENRNRRQFFMKADLISKKITETALRPNRGTNIESLMENNGEIFTLSTVDSENNTFVVSKIVNGEEEELNRHCYNNVQGKKLRVTHYAGVNNGLVLRARLSRNSTDSQEASTVYLEMFDFSTNKWKRTALPGFIRKNVYCINPLMVLGDKIFAVFRDPFKRNQFSIQTFEMWLTLSTRCIMNRIDKTNNTGDFEPIRDLLSNSLRLKLDNILKWKTAETEKELEKKQKVGVVQEVLRMEIDGIVDHRLERKLQTVFDSDFSDDSDSDITDAEDDAFNESDEEDDARRQRSVRAFHDERRMWWSKADHCLQNCMDMDSDDEESFDLFDEDGDAYDDSDDDQENEDIDDDDSSSFGGFEGLNNFLESSDEESNVEMEESSDSSEEL